MTKGFSPIDGKWKESIEKSVGQKRRTNPEAETVRRIQELTKQKPKKRP
jgi:hypothetical protein